MKTLFAVVLMIIGMGSTIFSQTVTIGTQVWMSKNLDVSTFRNGDPIPEAKTYQEWINAGSNQHPAWCYIEYDPANGAKYGKLYNWYAVNDPRGLAPVGYHIPSDEEWTILTDYLGGKDVAGKKMKSKSGWNSDTVLKTCPNCASWNAEYRSKVPCHTCKDTRSVNDGTKSGNGTNSSGFSGLPGGCCEANGAFVAFGGYGHWWSSSESGTVRAWYRNLYYSSDIVYRYYDGKGTGYSVRCLKD